MDIIVTKKGRYPAAKVKLGDKEFNAVIGKNGVVDANNKKEGDQSTPKGNYAILGVYYRPDRTEKPKTKVPVYEIHPDDIWIDDQSHSQYNRPAKIIDINGSISHEKLWRKDHLYDLFLDIGYNRQPTIPGKGSAIFMHIARDEEDPTNTPTAGCIALKGNDLLEVISSTDEKTRIVIDP
jgi:L,D-peptidoglycan transpeptidase YkuD (ErfK/YbiS/YcfS/YnhG family)